MLTLKSRRNVKSQYKVLAKRDLEDDIKDIEDFMDTFLREEYGIVKRLQVSENYMASFGNRTVSYHLLINHPLTVIDYVFGEDCVVNQSEVKVEVFQSSPAFIKVCDITEMSVLGVDVKQDDVFFSHAPSSGSCEFAGGSVVHFCRFSGADSRVRTASVVSGIVGRIDT